MAGRRRLWIALSLAGGTLVFLALYLRQDRGHATPAACLEAYREACKHGDVEAYLRCLGGQLREQVRSGYDGGRSRLAERLKLEMAEVKGWVETQEPATESASVWVDVDEIRPAGTRRLRFRLEDQGGGWVITVVEKGRDREPLIPYGTHISKTPG